MIFFQTRCGGAYLVSSRGSKKNKTARHSKEHRTSNIEQKDNAALREILSLTSNFTPNRRMSLENFENSEDDWNEGSDGSSFDEDDESHAYNSTDDDNSNNRFPDLLLLFLGLKDNFRIADVHAWDYLSLRDLMNVSLVSKSIRQSLQQIEYTSCRDGYDYLVPFPGFPGLFCTPQHQQHDGQHTISGKGTATTTSITTSSSSAGLFQHQLASLRAMTAVENPQKNREQKQQREFGCVRGGILGDAPGLGKTVTMLALISSTAGIRTVNPPEFWNAISIKDGWNLLRINEASRASILQTVKPLRNWIYDNYSKQSPISKSYRDFEIHISPPYRHKHQFPTIDDFQRYVIQQSNGALRIPLWCRELFRQNLVHLKAGLDKRHRKMLVSNEALQQRLKWERQLIPSSATLIVVPDALLEHWFQQIEQHLDLTRFVDENDNDNDNENHHHLRLHGQRRRGVVYLDGIGDLADARIPLGKVSLDSKVPPSWYLCKHLIVVTTFSRCDSEYRKEVTAGRIQLQDHKPEHSSTTSRKRGSNKTKQSSDTAQTRRTSRRKLASLTTSSQANSSSSGTGEPSPLLQVRWLRLVVDEGHELGTHEAGNNATRFIHQLAAERRWVLSGTPTTGDEDSQQFANRALDQLQRLLQFLRHERYGQITRNTLQQGASADSRSNTERSRKRSKKQHSQKNEKSSIYDSKELGNTDHDESESFSSSSTDQSKKKPSIVTNGKENWELQVKKPFLQKQEEGRKELYRILKEVMVMHRKEDINLPKPIFRQVEVDVPIPTTLFQEEEGNAFQIASESTMPTQYWHTTNLHDKLNQYLRSDEFQSLVDQAQAQYIVEAIRLAQTASAAATTKPHGLSSSSTAIVAEYDTQAQEIRDQRPIKAVVYSSEKNNLLSVAEHLYRQLSPSNIAEMHSDIGDMNPELSRFRNNCKESRQCQVCHAWCDLVGNNAGGGRGAAQRCPNTLLEVTLVDRPYTRCLIEPERICRAISIADGGTVRLDRLDGDSLSEYRHHKKKWRVGDVLQVDIRDPHPLLPTRKTQEVWESWGSNECEETAEDLWYFGPLPWDGTNDRVNVKLVKWQACGKFHNHNRWFDGPRLMDSPVETIQEDVFVLCLDAGLSHGLDLSFVTHLFLLEPIDDAALLEQVTSRAHRLGATGPVTVETVNTLYKLGPAMQLSIRKYEESRQVVTGEDNAIRKSNALTKVVCQHCYRQFDSIQLAEEHERTICPRNPENASVVDRFHLSSVYREIRPPPPLVSAEVEKK